MNAFLGLLLVFAVGMAAVAFCALLLSFVYIILPLALGCWFVGMLIKELVLDKRHKGGTLL